MACSCLLDKNVLQTKNHLGTGEDKIDNNMLNWECNAKYLKYLKYYQKRSKWTKNSDFFASEAYTTLSQYFELSLIILGLKLTILQTLF